MNCRRFEQDLPDWIQGRLPESQAAGMLAHSGSCSRCAAMVEGERQLQSLWRGLPQVREAADLWPRVAARIEDLGSSRETAPRLHWRDIFSLRPLRYGLGSACAAIVIATVIVARQPAVVPTDPGIASSPIRPQDAVDENHVLQLVSDRRALPEADGDLAIGHTARYREAERVVFGERTE